MKWIAVDFETANERRCSPCSVGLAWIEGGKVTRVEERLIRPKEMRFSSFNIAIHGIRPEHVKDAPEFPDVMAEFRDDLPDAVLIAHNAAFDMSVWRATLDLYGMPYPEFEYLCTLQMARRVWPDLESYRLSAIGDYLGIAFRHHNAAEDASACGRIALAAADHLGVSGIDMVPERIGIAPGRIHASGYSPCSGAGWKSRRASSRWSARTPGGR